MSFSDMSEFNEEGRIPIPLDVESDDYEDAGYFGSNSKMGRLFVYLIICALILAFMILFLEISPASPISILYYIIVAVGAYRVFTKHVLEEDKIYSSYLELKEFKPTDLQKLWHIYDITEDGCCKYDNTIRAYVVKAEKGSILGREDSYRKVNQSIIERFIRMIVGAGLHVRIENCTEVVDKEKMFSMYYERINNPDLTNENLKKISKAIISHIKRNSRLQSEVEVDYFLVYATTVRTANNMLRILKEAVAELQLGVFSSVTILNKEEVIEYFKATTGVSFIGTERLMNNISNFSRIPKDVFRVVKKFDDTGTQKFEFDEELDTESADIDHKSPVSLLNKLMHRQEVE